MQHSHFRGNGRASRLSRGSGGNYYNCASRFAGLCLVFPLLLRRGEVRTNVGLWSSGLGAFVLVASCPTVKYGWLRPSGLRCWELTFPRFFCRDCWHHVEVTFEWNGCSLIFMSAFRLFFYGDTPTSGVMAGSPASAKKVGEILCYYCYCFITNPRVTPAGSPATVTRVLLLLLICCLFMQVLCCYCYVLCLCCLLPVETDTCRLLCLFIVIVVLD